MNHVLVGVVAGSLVAGVGQAALAQSSLPLELTGAPPRPAPTCVAPEYRQFDFFAGDWDTYDVGEPTRIVARNRVTAMLGGCAVREVYRQTDGLAGESFSTYDAPHGTWHQSWVTNRGTLLLLTGRLEGDRMVLTGTETAADGASSLLRSTWFPVPNAVRETAERSTHGGKSWKPVFDIVFRPHDQKKGP